MRDLTSGVQTAIVADQVSPILFFEGEFASGFVRAWSGLGDLYWNSQTWTGTGTLLSISNIEETSDGSARGVTATLSGLSSDLISLALADVRQGASGKVWLGFLDNGVVDDPILLFEGRLDIPAIEEDGETSSISISYESRLIDLERSRETRYTNEGQQALYAGDLGCEYVAALQDKQINWGKK